MKAVTSSCCSCKRQVNQVLCTFSGVYRSHTQSRLSSSATAPLIFPHRHLIGISPIFAIQSRFITIKSCDNPSSPPKKRLKPMEAHEIPRPPAPLTPEIEELHRQACMQGKTMYIDPQTGYKVFTAFSHVQRGKCCGSKCRHCPFDHENVKTKK